MHRKVWFLVAAAGAVLALTGTAAATGGQKAAAASSAGKVQPFAKSWAATPRTPAARQASKTINVAEEQDLGNGCGWNINNASCTLAWAVWAGWNPILRGPFLVAYKNGHYVYQPDLITKNPQVTSSYIKYTIKSGAKWNYGGHVSPVTWQDFAYTVELLNNPHNDVSSNVGVNQIASVKHSGNTVTFYWKKAGQKALGGDNSTIGCTGNNACGPFADYKDLIGSLYPYAATKSLNFNTNMFAHCICGANGKYVTDGPYYMSNYTRGQGVTLKANPKGWYGAKPKITTVNFKDITNVDSEIQAIKGGEVDVASPQPTPSIAPLAHVSSITYKVAPGNYLEHIDLQNGNTGPQTTTLMKQAWFRQAIMMGINRAGIISAALPGVAPGLKPLDSLLVFQSDARYKAPFHKWNYNPAGVIAKMKANGCTGGPNSPSNSNSNYWTCNGHHAEFQFMYASDNSRRVASFQIIQANLKAVGIKVDANGVPTSTLFGDNGAPAGNYDATEFAWGGSVDPGGFISIWGCGGGENWLNYCNHTVTNNLNATLTQLNTAKRNNDFIAADAGMSNDVPAIPLYALPEIVTYKKKVTGVVTNPAAGFTWNMENWGWKS